VRLGTCIALELAVAVGAIGGVVIGVQRATSVAGVYFAEREAAAATVERSPAPARLPTGRLDIAAPAMLKTVFDASDDVLLGPLAATPLAKVKVNRGGTSLSLRLEFASGARAAFKPQQIHPQSDPRREIAAYRIDRLLWIGHVPPAKPGTFSVDDLVAAVEPGLRNYVTGRLADEAIAKDGVVHGELSWWIPEIRDLAIAGTPVDEAEGMALWTGYLQAGATIPPEVRPLVEQLATCVVFDIIIDNADRWSGSNTKGSPDGKTLYFMDNTLSFSLFTLGHEANLRPLDRIEVFPRGLVKRLRALTVESVTAALASDDIGLGPLLQPAEIDALLARRDHLVHHIDQLIAKLGEDAVLALP